MNTGAQGQTYLGTWSGWKKRNLFASGNGNDRLLCHTASVFHFCIRLIHLSRCFLLLCARSIQLCHGSCHFQEWNPEHPKGVSFWRLASLKSPSQPDSSFGLCSHIWNSHIWVLTYKMSTHENGRICSLIFAIISHSEEHFSLARLFGVILAPTLS